MSNKFGHRIQNQFYKSCIPLIRVSLYYTRIYYALETEIQKTQGPGCPVGILTHLYHKMPRVLAQEILWCSLIFSYFLTL
jgi:hypothetical protein